MIERRAFLRGLIAAPAIVAIGNIMPVKNLLWTPPAFGFATGQWNNLLYYVLYDIDNGYKLGEGSYFGKPPHVGDVIKIDGGTITLA